MRVAIIGRTEMLYEAAQKILAEGHQIVCVITATAAGESQRKEDDFRGLAESAGAPFARGYRFTGELVELLRNSSPDIAIAMNWPTMIGPEVVEAAGLGIVNSHGSDLPKYRGNACPNWAILNGEKEIGLTFHYIDPFGLDTGPVILKKFISNHPGLYIGEVYDWLRREVPNGFSEVLDLVQRPGFRATPQNEEGAIRVYPRRPDDGRIRWDRTMEQIHRLVRASAEPFPGAFSFIEGEVRLTIWRAEQRPQPYAFMAEPGQLMYWENEAPVIACSDGGVALVKVELPAGQKMPRSVRTRLS